MVFKTGPVEPITSALKWCKFKYSICDYYINSSQISRINTNAIVRPNGLTKGAAANMDKYSWGYPKARVFVKLNKISKKIKVINSTRFVYYNPRLSS